MYNIAAVIILEKSTNVLKPLLHFQPLPHSPWSRLAVAARDTNKQLEKSREAGGGRRGTVNW